MREEILTVTLTEPPTDLGLRTGPAGCSQTGCMADLKAAIGWNERCAPFTWTKDDTILAKATPRSRHASTSR